MIKRVVDISEAEQHIQHDIYIYIGNRIYKGLRQPFKERVEDRELRLYIKGRDPTATLQSPTKLSAAMQVLHEL